MSIGERIRGDCCVQDGREQFRLVPASIEPELKFVQVALKMFGADSVIGASLPRLDIAEDSVSPGVGRPPRVVRVRPFEGGGRFLFC